MVPISAPGGRERQRRRMAAEYQNPNEVRDPLPGRRLLGFPPWTNSSRSQAGNGGGPACISPVGLRQRCFCATLTSFGF